MTNVPSAPHGALVVLSGASGSGKTTLAADLMAAAPTRFRLLRSITTRLPRLTDSPDEYEHLSDGDFRARWERGEFIWDASNHGYHYAFSHADIEAACAAPYASICCVVPERALQLLQLKPTHVRVFYLLSPAPAELRRRMAQRGDPPADIKRRMNDCRDWDQFARAQSGFIRLNPVYSPHWAAVVRRFTVPH